MAYFINQNLKWRFPSNKGAALGSCVHKVLEYFAHIKLAQQQNKSMVLLDIGEINISDFDILSIIDKTYQYFTSQDTMKHIQWSDKEYKTYKTYVNTAITHNNGYFNPLKKNIIALEQYINYTIDENWAILPDGSNLRITGIIDLVLQDNDNTIQIWDWKTSSTLSDFNTGETIDLDYLQKDIQLMLYALVAPKIYGEDKNYICTMFFLKQKTPLSVAFSHEELKLAFNKIKHRFLEISKCSLPKLNRTWKCTKTCDFGKNTFENTKIKPISQFLPNGIAPIGSPMTICDQTFFELNRRGLNWVIENLKNDN